MTTNFNTTLKATFFSRPKQLTITPQTFHLDQKIIPKEKITAVRYGVKPIRGYNFNIGRVYCVDIKLTNETVINIRLKTIYKIKNAQLQEKYVNIVNNILNAYFSDIAQDHINNYDNGKNITIADTIVLKEGIILDGKQNLLLWNDIGLRKYTYYFIIFSKTNANNYRMYEYTREWNASVLYAAVQHILNSRRLLTNT